jgi:aminopeptidase-like protein
VLGEPQLGKRGLYPAVSTKDAQVPLILNLLTWADGERSLFEIADRCDVPVWDLYGLLDQLREHGLLVV